MQAKVVAIVFSIPSLQYIKSDIHQTKQQLLNTQFSNVKSFSDPVLQCIADMFSVKCSSVCLTGARLSINKNSILWNYQGSQATVLVVLDLVPILLLFAVMAV